MNYFVVFQNKTFTQEHDEGILWAPKETSNGGEALFHWKSMLSCKEGDIVFSIVKNKVVARGIVLSEAKASKNPFDNDEWGQEGWLVEIEYYFTDSKIKIMNHIDAIRPYLPAKYSPFNPATGKGNQGYLYPINKELGTLLDNLVQDVYFGDDFNTVFQVDSDESEMIAELYDQEGLDEGEVVLIEEPAPSFSNKPKTKRSKIFGKKTDFINKAKKDKETGVKAEILVLNYEKQNLINAGREDLAEKVKWVAKEADGYGYDVLSFEEDGREKFIEVKGTVQMKTTPFDISENEVQTSIIKGDNYWIYRVYYINESIPKFYKYNGAISNNFEIIATSYKAYIKE